MLTAASGKNSFIGIVISIHFNKIGYCIGTIQRVKETNFF